MVLIKPPLTVSDEAFRIFRGQNPSKKTKFDLSDIPADTVITLSIRAKSGKVVVGEYDSALKSFVLSE